jgi:hypothetical protein
MLSPLRVGRVGHRSEAWYTKVEQMEVYCEWHAANVSGDGEEVAECAAMFNSCPLWTEGLNIPLGNWWRFGVHNFAKLQRRIYCILASCYIRFKLNICSIVHQYNIHFYFLLFVDMFRPHTAIFKCSCWWCAYCQCPCVRIFMLSLWPPCCLQATLIISTPSAGAHG